VPCDAAGDDEYEEGTAGHSEGSFDSESRARGMLLTSRSVESGRCSLAPAFSSSEGSGCGAPPLAPLCCCSHASRVLWSTGHVAAGAELEGGEVGVLAPAPIGMETEWKKRKAKE
jgi:hypothetical protein